MNAPENALPLPRVEVHDSADDLATAVAGAFLRLVTVRQSTGDVPQVGLTGGSIADKTHREIARLPVDPARIYEIPSTADADAVDDAAARYADTVRATGHSAFDLLMLGVGPDGHVASLFPGFPQLDVEDQIAVGVTDSPKPPPQRVSLTFPALGRSQEVWFVVSGADKAAAVGHALETPPPAVHELPAAGVRGQVATIWFLDRDAASRVHGL